jgi:hypothetical protein
MTALIPDDSSSIPKVFISYSYDDEQHINWVKELAVKLRNNGINAILDQFTRLGTDLALFIEQGLGESHRVLCICSTEYNKKANAGISGVAYEKRIICQELMKESSSAWVIPIIRNNKSEEKLPKFLSSLKYILFEDDSQFPTRYYELLEELYNKRGIPPIGPNPFVHGNNIIGKINENNQIAATLASISCHAGRIKFNYLSNSGKFTIGSGDYEFITGWSNGGIDSIWAYKDYAHAIASTSQQIDINNFLVNDFDFSSRARLVHIGESVIWINNQEKILVTKIENVEFENNQKHWVEISYHIITILEQIDTTEGENL